MQIASNLIDSEKDWAGTILIDQSCDLTFLVPFFEKCGVRVRFYSEAYSGMYGENADFASCLLLSIETGIAFLSRPKTSQSQIPVILFADSTDVALAVKAIKLGAADVLERPVDSERLIASIQNVLASKITASHPSQAVVSLQDPRAVQAGWESLTVRQRDFLHRIVAGESTRAIAMVLGISQRTADNHRAAIMKKMGASSPSALMRIALGLEASFERIG